MADKSRTDSFGLGTDEALARFWNALGQGVQPEYAAIDPELVDTVMHVHKLGAARPPEPEFLRRLRDKLFVTEATGSTTTHVKNGFRLNGRDARSVRRSELPAQPSLLEQWSEQPSRPSLRQRRWELACAVAALLLVFGIGYVLFGSGLRDDDQRVTIPAAVAPTETSTPDVRSEGTVVEVTIPAAVLPAGEAGAALAHFTLPPGTTSTWTVFHNAMLNAVLEGTLVVRSGSPIQVLRAPGDGEWETVPGSAEVSLGPGDLVLLLNVTTADFDNPGDVPVELVQWSLAAGMPTAGPMPMTWVLHDYDLSGGGRGGGVSLTGRPARLQFQRKVLAPGDTIPAAPEGVLQLVIGMPDNGAGTPVAAPYIVRGINGKADNYGSDPILVYMITLTFVASDGSPPAGTPPP